MNWILTIWNGTETVTPWPAFFIEDACRIVAWYVADALRMAGGTVSVNCLPMFGNLDLTWHLGTIN